MAKFDPGRGRTNDFYAGTDEDDIIIGRGGSDTLYGADGDDVIKGASDGDLLGGGSGNDIIRGGLGRDTMSGDDGSDLFKWRSTNTDQNGQDLSSTDLITDFQGAGDPPPYTATFITKSSESALHNEFVIGQGGVSASVNETLFDTENFNFVLGGSSDFALNTGGSEPGRYRLAVDLNANNAIDAGEAVAEGLVSDLAFQQLVNASDGVHNLLLGFEDWTDDDFNDLVVRVQVEPPCPTDQDVIDLRSIDANVNRAGNQHFVFGTSLTISDVEGGSLISLDTNKDGQSDFTIGVDGVMANEFAASDFLL